MMGVLTAGALANTGYELIQPRTDLGLGEVWRARRSHATPDETSQNVLYCEVLGLSPENLKLLEAEFQRSVGLLRRFSAVHAATVSDGGGLSNGVWVTFSAPESPSLAQWIEAFRHGGERPELGEVFPLFTAICAGLQSAHTFSRTDPIVHGALSPHSVLVTKDRAVRAIVTDFKLGRFVEPDLHQHASRVRDYLPPEANDRTFTDRPEGDVFALGVVLVEMLTTRATPESADLDGWASVSATRGWQLPELLRQLRGDVPDAVWTVIARALSADRERRYANAGTLRLELERALPAAAAVPASAPQRGPGSVPGGPPVRQPPRALPAAGRGGVPRVASPMIAPTSGADTIPNARVEPSQGRVQADGFVGERYKIQRRIHNGPMSRVFVAVDERTLEHVALKVMDERLAENARARDRFLREARIPAQFMGAAKVHVVRMLDVVTDSPSGPPYLVMELLHGQRLDQRIRSDGRFSPDRTVEVAEQLAEVLAEAARLKIIHGDLKPENLVLERIGQHEILKVLDFGSARLGLAETQEIAGSPLFVSPEQLDHQGISEVSDIWAFGLLCFYMLVGRYYWHEQLHREQLFAEILRHEMTPASVRARELNAELPRELDRWFSQCVSRKPSERFQSAQTAVDALRSSLGVSGERRFPMAPPEDLPGGDSGARHTTHNYPLVGHYETVRGLVVSADGLMLASAGSDRIVRVWDLARHARLTELHGHEDTVNALGWLGGELVSASADGTVRVWDLREGQGRVLSGQGALFALATTENPSPMIFVAGADRTVRYWRLPEERRIQVGVQGGMINALAISRHGRFVVSATSGDNSLAVWDIEKRTRRKTLVGHEADVLAVSLSSDDGLIVSGSRDRTVRVWDTGTGQCRQVLQGHRGDVRGVVVLPGGRFVVSGSADGTVRLWDLEKLGTCVEIFDGHRKPDGSRAAVWCVTCTPEGARLISGGSDGAVRIWERELPGQEG